MTDVKHEIPEDLRLMYHDAEESSEYADSRRKAMQVRGLIERIAQLTAERDQLALKSHKWVGRMVGGSSAEATSSEWICFCEFCGSEDTCEEGMPPCEVTRETLIVERDAALRECERLDRCLTDANAALMDWENREASVCPEDVGFEEFVGALKAELSRLKAPVSDEEWGKGCHLANRSHVNDIIASRSKPLEEKP